MDGLERVRRAVQHDRDRPQRGRRAGPAGRGGPRQRARRRDIVQRQRQRPGAAPGRAEPRRGVGGGELLHRRPALQGRGRRRLVLPRRRPGLLHRRLRPGDRRRRPHPADRLPRLRQQQQRRGVRGRAARAPRRRRPSPATSPSRRSSATSTTSTAPATTPSCATTRSRRLHRRRVGPQPRLRHRPGRCRRSAGRRHGGRRAPRGCRATPADCPGVRGRAPERGGPGGAGEPNVLVERFTAVQEWADLVEQAKADLTEELYDSGYADDVLDQWITVLTEQAGDLVDAATVEEEADAIRTAIGG